MLVNVVIGDTERQRDLARVMQKHSHFDLQSCLAVVVLHELGQLGIDSEELNESYDAAMTAHRTEIQNRQLAKIAGGDHLELVR